MKLIIVESPHKAKTISHIMGSDYIVKASVGHIRDLAKNEISIDLETLKPKYSFIDAKKRTIVNELKAIAGRADEVIIASDPDREGEAIAWHLKESLNLKKYKRAEFHEITTKGVKEGLSNTKQIDMNLVYAQEARRVIDRLIGYGISPKLSNAVIGAKSAGRVQTAALRLILRRESEHTDFKSQSKYAVDCEIDQNGNKFKATVIRKKEDTKASLNELDNKKEADIIETKLSTVKSAQIINIEHKDIKKNAPAPFTTSTYQQAVNNILNISSDDAMKIAQKLYEGGYITYMRTDSVRLSDEAKSMAKKYITVKYGDKYYLDHAYKNKDSSQDAHEAIRPSDIYRKTDKLDKNEINVYNLIAKRFLASQMSPAVYDQINIYVQATDYILKATGSKLIFKGYQAVYAESVKDSNMSLFVIKEGTAEMINAEIRNWLTKPKPRYTESSLIKELEAKGLGRPSTYANIIKTLKLRGYIKITGKKILPSDIANKAMRWLISEFDDFFNIGYTAKMEERLDKIAEGKDTYKAVAGDNLNKLKEHNIDFIGGGGYKPSDKQISFAEKLSKEQNIPLPVDYKTDGKACKEFIGKNTKSQSTFEPSDKQIAFAEKLSKDRGTKLPKGYRDDYKICKKYIDKSLKKKEKKK